MKRIDFLGAPGVGKTTLYSKLLADKCDIISYDQALIKSAIKISKKKKSLFNMLIGFGLMLPYLKVYLANMIVKKEGDENFENIFNNNIKFFEAVDQLFAKGHQEFSYRKYLGIQSFLSKFLKIQVIEEVLKEDLWVVDDESLSQKIFNLYGIREYEKKDKELLVRYFETIPKPSIVVHVKKSQEEILSNIEKRKKMGGKVIPGHSDIHIDELNKRIQCAIQITKIASGILKSHGVDVVEIADNLAKVKEKINRWDG